MTGSKSTKKIITKKPKLLNKKVEIETRLKFSKDLNKKLKIRKKSNKKTPHTTLKKYIKNPIISPVQHKAWESRATFNPSAIYGGGKVHLIYRAIGDRDVSNFGYAMSCDGLSINKRSHSPAYVQKMSLDRKDIMFSTYSSGGGTQGGSEDPRLTQIEDRVYMTYTSFDGWSAIRIALTSISLEDFINERWNWKEPVFISPPGEIHKNWVIFPKKINGKYAILTGISPKIMIKYVKDLNEFDGRKFIESNVPNGKGYDNKAWDNCLRGVGPSPLYTKEGWLVLYHAMDTKDPNRYKLGAMLLDLKDPTKITARSKTSILEPDECYENEGHKNGVVYSCGAVIIKDWLFVYYGGADTVTCVAAAELKPFIEELLNNKSAKLSKPKLKKK